MVSLLIIAAIIFIIEYYSFIALRKVIHRLHYRLQLSIIIPYLALTICILWGFYALHLWADTSWPSNLIKFAVNIFVGIFIGKLLVTIIMFLGDIILIFKSIFNYLLPDKKSTLGNSSAGKQQITRSEFISKTALICGGALASGLAYGMTNRYDYKVRRVQLPLQGLPGNYKGLRIAQISDIHSGSFDNSKAVSEGVEAIMQENPDLILFTGDLVNFRANEIVPYLNIFNRLQAPLGVYSILGNHDYGDYVSWPSESAKMNDLKELQGYHKAMGWQLLMNEHMIMQQNGRQIALIGVENWSARARFPQYGDLKKAMSGLENMDLPLKILMSHDPSHWDAEVRRDYPDIALTLSGHTHGMQFGIDIPGFKWSPVQYLYKQWAGLYQEKNQYLYVNRGFGFIGYQGRLGVLPEITVIDLV